MCIGCVRFVFVGLAVGTPRLTIIPVRDGENLVLTMDQQSTEEFIVLSRSDVSVEKETKSVDKGNKSVFDVCQKYVGGTH